ncbi:MAG: hypothetical protein M1322_02505 [Candidatus Parvarchaeota archaeon]|jgi:hypothetical protein|nr:hypothetical protein [Candidatus Parvarchaeota archaeon]MCL5106962.1 hypothetical protein [Candidatus Parvarchaeota archaeon]
MSNFIFGVIPNAVLSSEKDKTFYLFFGQASIFGVIDANVDKLLSESPVGMWPASGAVIDTPSPSVSLSSFKDKTLKKDSLMGINESYIRKLSSFVIEYTDIKNISVSLRYNELINIDVQTSYNSFLFVTDYIDRELFYEYKEMLNALFGERLSIG